MINKLPEEAKNILNKISYSGHQVYVVGGPLRDLILGKEAKDWDFTTDAKPEEILIIFPEGFYNNKFGTVGIPTDYGVIEITTMRKEGKYRDFRHPDKIVWTDRIEEDLARRDFTINAMAISSDEKLIDPFGGQKDISDKIIRAVGNPDLRFREDALRLMRAVRFSAQLGFEVEKVTFEAIKNNANLITHVSFERIRDELLKIITSQNPDSGIKLLKEVGILKLVLPELDNTFGVEQKGPRRSRWYDIGEHSLAVLKLTPSNDPITKLAALLHDIGKANTKNIEGDGTVTFYNHDIVGGKMVLKIAKRFNLSNKDMDKLYRLVRWHLFTVDEKQTDAAIRRIIKNVGLENINDLLALRIGDRLGGGTEKAVSWRMEKFRERIKEVLKKPFTVADLKVSGHDVMEILQIPQGRRVGEVLDELFKEVLEDHTKNDREYLLGRIKEYK
jgi:tRNA nucleotidyltransferase (CCA-adding enzyme)